MKRRKALAALVGGLMMTTAWVHPVKAEPVSGAIGLTTLIWSTFAVSVSTAAAIGGAIVTSAISIGLSFAQSAMAHKGTGPLPLDATASQASEQRLSTRQSSPPKRIPYGTVFCGGALFFEKVKPPYLYRGYLISARKINALRALYIGTNKVEFSQFTPNTILTPLFDPDGGPDYINNLKVSVRLGEDDQAIDPILAAGFPELDAEFRQRGIATVVCRYDFGDDDEEHRELWGASGQASTFFVVDGVSVFDQRDPTQDIDDEATWKFSSNATLCQADYLRQNYGGRIPARKLAWDKIIESADFDDEVVACKDGTYIKRYTVDGLLTLNQTPFDVLKSMLSANRATISQGGGKVWISSAKPKRPVICIYDDLIAGALQVRNEKLKRDQINIVQTRFISEDREYNLVDGPILRRDDLITADGEELIGTLDLPWTRDYRRVERLQKAFLESSRLGKSVSCPLDIRALAEAKQELISETAIVDSALFPIANGETSINGLAFSPDFTTIQFEMSETDQSIEIDWNADEDETDFTVAELDLS